MSTEFSVERGVPIPPLRNPKKYPWDSMDIGDSFFIPNIKSNAAGAYSAHRAKMGEKHTVRTVDGGVRIWRIK